MAIPVEAFFDELSKIAEQDEFGAKLPKKDKERIGGLGAGLVASNLATAGSGIVGKVGGQALGSNLLSDIERSGLSTTPREVKAIRDAMGAKTKVYLHKGNLSGALHVPKGGLLPKSMRQAEEIMYSNAGLPNKVIQHGFKGGVSAAPRSAGAHIMAHELGHARLRQTGVGKIINKARPFSSAAGILAATNMAALADPDSAVSKAAPIVGAAGIAPILLDEGYASLKGYGTMKRMGTYSKPALKSARRQLLKAFGTYGLATALPAVAAPLAIRYARKRYKRKSEGQG